MCCAPTNKTPKFFSLKGKGIKFLSCQQDQDAMNPIYESFNIRSLSGAKLQMVYYNVID